MKKLAFLMAVMMMFTLLLAGCNNTTTSSAPERGSAADGTESTPADGDNPYAGIDLSKEETIVLCDGYRAQRYGGGNGSCERED